eukprot:516874_1
MAYLNAVAFSLYDNHTLCVTHITLYLIAYFITSIYCAVKTSKQKIAKSNWYSPIKSWYKSTSSMSKVYLSCIPHIFDQATDFGLVAQWYFLWQQEETGINVVGANMKQLFFASTGIIVFHHIVSSAG